MDFVALGDLDYKDGTETQFSQKIELYWEKWIHFCSKTGIEDKCL